MYNENHDFLRSPSKLKAFSFVKVTESQNSRQIHINLSRILVLSRAE